METKKTIKAKIEKEFPKLFKKEQYNINDWVYWSGLNPGYGFMRGQCPGFSDSLDICLIEDTEKVTSCSKSNLRKATDKEVETALIKEAKRRGFKEGNDIGDFNGIGSELIHSSSSQFSPSTNMFFRGGFCVFNEGKWATIKTITKEQAEKELGKTIIE